MSKLIGNSEETRHTTDSDEENQSPLPDLSNSTWQKIASLPVERRNAACVVIDSNRILLIGGTDGENILLSCVLYDRTSGKWTSLGESCDLPKALEGSSAVCVDGKVYVAGGSDDVFLLDTSIAFDPLEWKWTRKECKMNGKRMNCELVSDGKFLYALGGVILNDEKMDPENTTNSVVKYNITSGQWEDAPPMLTKRSGLTAVLVGTKLYAIGGFDGSKRLRTTEVLDFSSKEPTWERASSMNNSLSGHAAVVIDKYVVVSGGCNSEQEVVSSVEVLDTISGKWTEIKNGMLQARLGHGSAVLNKTEVYAVGGNKAGEKISLHQLRPSRYEDGTRCPTLRNDLPDGEDLLGIKDEINAIAQVIALQDFLAPFAVAILGEWGSGKSTVMNLILARLKRFQQYDLRDETREHFPYCGHIYYVRFDCWTYAKGDLWASLMHQILVHLNGQLNLEKIIGNDILMRGVSTIELMDHFGTTGKQAYLEKKIADEEKQGQVRKLINSKNSNITRALIDATTCDYEEDVKNLKNAENELAWRGMTDPHLHLEVKPAMKTLLNVCYKKYEAQSRGSDSSIPRTIFEGVNKIRYIERLYLLFRAGNFTMSWTIVFSLAMIASILLPLLWDNLEGLYALVAPFITGIIGIISKIKAAETELSEVQHAFQAAVENAHQNRGFDTNEDLEGQATTAAELKTRITELRNRVWFFEGESLDDVVKDRVNSGEYEDRLGIVHKAKTDLEHISNAMLSNAKADKYKDIKDKMFPRGDPRIVLFVDDTDRCSPNKVVEVFEAVQLLAKTKLFVIVMAIDSRYASLALESCGSYENVLFHENTPSGLDFLGKIFQLTYRVPPIQFKSDLAKYTKYQMKPFAVGREITERDLHERIKNSGSGESGERRVESPKIGANEMGRDGVRKSPAHEFPRPLLKLRQESTLTLKELPSTVLKFTAEEAEMMIDALMIADVSPRANKRIVNAFKLLVIIWYERERKAPDEETKKALVLLLAFSGSKSRVIRHGMLKMFTLLAKNLNREIEIAGKRNLLGVLDSSFDSLELSYDPLDQFRSTVNPMLSRLAWNNLDELIELKRELRLIRAFSFLGEEEETGDLLALLSERAKRNLDKRGYSGILDHLAV